ncbi:ABC transporter permease [Paenibacillus sp. IB182496]|uniref:ABC transporter permease n=1 Tax=Paenibacillus sabuli TaxID=2772509 RepID=A0A927BS94_9BACL|nr:ABC transporter permease [Paenibacillus sabuli]MBD2845846.1 ABC transporter permease [Paenibacillus sabuli]
MKLTQGLRMAWHSVYSQRMRTALTVLGMMIGIASVTIMVAIGNGTAEQVKSQMQGLGTNLLTVNVVGRGATTSISLEDAEALVDIEGVSASAPVITGNVTAKYKAATYSTSIAASTPSYAKVREYEVAQGRFIKEIDGAFAQKVAVIGSEVAEELELSDPVGEKLTLGGIPYTIVGVLAEKGSSSGGSNDNLVVVPIQTARVVLQTNAIRTLYVQAAGEQQVDSVQSALEFNLQRFFRNDENSYSVFNQADLLETVTAVSTSMSTMLTYVAGISLLVGGIGIMNMMLVSVTERTREIGIRKSLGAKRRDIMLQFLVEAALIGGLGGIAGAAAGAGGAGYAGKLMDSPASASTDIMLLAVAFSMGVGVLFGFLPARRASKLNPVDALRH